MKTFLILTTLLAAVSPTGDPLADLYLRQYLGIKIAPRTMSKYFFSRQVEFNTRFLASVVGPENMVSGTIATNRKKKTTASYSVHSSPLKLKEKLTTITHFTRKVYPMGFRIHKLQWIGENDFKIYMSKKNKNLILYFKYNRRHKLFNVWIR
tara:strand:- start:51 stop:506 length:456 start_codon:yes stop_codon:yes gene_type:complete